MSKDKDTKKEKEVTKTKCPKCHAYFVDEGELCGNCQKKEDAKE